MSKQITLRTPQAMGADPFPGGDASAAPVVVPWSPALG